jgi:hypothetical protein
MGLDALFRDENVIGPVSTLGDYGIRNDFRD